MLTGSEGQFLCLRRLCFCLGSGYFLQYLLHDPIFCVHFCGRCLFLVFLHVSHPDE